MVFIQNTCEKRIGDVAYAHDLSLSKVVLSFLIWFDGTQDLAFRSEQKPNHMNFRS